MSVEKRNAVLQAVFEHDYHCDQYGYRCPSVIALAEEWEAAVRGDAEADVQRLRAVP